MLRKLLWIGLMVLIPLVLLAAGFLTWGYYRITRDLPQLTSIEDYRPPAVSQVFARDGTLIAEFYEQRRYPIKIKDVPVHVRNAFLAAEDANFYRHQGIDPISIIRALLKNIQTGSARQGGSTITQQVVKNLLLNPEKRLERKIKEAILSYRLERRFSKDEILEIYLNQIYFGNTAYGLKAAALIYFHRPVEKLSVAQAALLAGLPKAPSRYSPLENFPMAKRRQRYVLHQMEQASFIDRDQYEESLKERLDIYPASAQNIYHAPYFVTEVRRILTESQPWKNYNVDSEGLQIHTTLDLDAERMATNALRRGLREVDKRRGWRGVRASFGRPDKQLFLKNFPSAAETVDFEAGMTYPAMVTELIPGRGIARIDLGRESSAVDLKAAAWARKRLELPDNVSWIVPEQSIKAGDVIEVALIDQTGSEANQPATPAGDILPGVPRRFQLDQTPDLEGAVDLIDPHSGRVLVAIGGYDYTRSQFNRVTQGLRQPGSTFKPVIYLTAIDKFQYTPATIVHDVPRTFRVGETLWAPANFDGKFLGPITLRTALEKSRNLISADIISRIGVDAAIMYAHRLGIESKLGRNLSLALGSSEVTLLELTRAYGVFAAKGILFGSTFIEKVVDRDGTILYDFENERTNKAQRAVSENSAFIMANMMKGVVENGTGYKVKEIKRPVAGKTGTSNDQMDAWFIGYTPSWVCGVWVGFDEKRKIGEKETGGVVAAPIWLYLMREFLDAEDKRMYEKLVGESKSEAERLGIPYSDPDPLEPLDFSVPDGVDPFWVERSTGLLASPGAPGAILEYFLKGTEPRRTAAEIGDDDMPSEEVNSYFDSPDL